MADIATTSSKTILEKDTTPHLPKSGNTQILTKLAQNLSESYQMVKERQQRYYEYKMKVSGQKPMNMPQSHEDESDGEGEWQEVTNKLKRKKKMSSSLTSVSDTVNQEKRTRIEGMQLNCRGKLQLKDHIHSDNGGKVTTKSSTTAPQQTRITTPQTVTPSRATPPPRLKRKLQENVLTIQKLNALGEQLRLEINELKSNLITERNAVRVLRAQNESETRKWKSEVKKLQGIIELMKKNNNQLTGNNVKKPTELNAEAASTPSLANYEIQRLTNELQALKEAYKALEEKKMINGDADRRKAADVREMKDSYEIRLTQLSKSAKIEISRLLEEIKSKDRNIGQLKKELQLLQTKTQQEQNKSRNATTSPKVTKQTTNKPKKNHKKSLNESNVKDNQSHNEEIKKKLKETDCENTENENKDTTSKAQDTNEMKNLKDLELFNNTKNLQNSVTINLVKPTVKVNSNNRLQSSKLKSLVNIFENESQKIQNSKNDFSKNDKRHFTTTISCCTTLGQQSKQEQEQQQHQQSHKEFHSLPHELNARLIDANDELTKELITETERDKPKNRTTTEIVNEVISEHEYRTKDHNSDSDSALSSAPPSISPQPPPADMQTNDIWQTIRTYTSDIDKLQKDVDALQKENDCLRAELEVAKEQILENEKTAMETTMNNKQLKSLKDRIQFLEQQEHELQSECNELREQNELLEFRILELEDNSDKWSLPCQNAAQQTTTSAVSNDVMATQPQNLWNCKADGTSNERRSNIYDYTNEELSQRVTKMLNDLTLQKEEKQCLQQVLDLLTQRNISVSSSGPNSFNMSSSSDEPSSFELVKSRISDYSSGLSSSPSSSSSPSASTSSSNCTNPIFENLNNCLKPPKTTAANCRIVATVPPYNSSQAVHIAPNNTPNDSPRKSRNCTTPTTANSWQSNSLSESGVFVESDFFSDASVEQHACTQTDFEEEEEQNLQNTVQSKVPVAIRAVAQATVFSSALVAQHTAQLNDPKRLQYYQDRLRLLENKLLVYESSGDQQTKRLADRLQREIQLEKELHELRDRVEFLESENATLEEEKCEFEEAENDTRLRLQRLEVELEILSQRNVELELSKEALSAKYKDCRSECLILRDDLAANETQLRNLCEDKRKAKENLEFLHSLLPLLNAYSLLVASGYSSSEPAFENDTTKTVSEMGNVAASSDLNEMPPNSTRNPVGDGSCCCKKLQEEVKCLQHKLRQCNERYHEAMESADTHWLDLELEYKEREKAARAKEQCLKQKISQLEDILRADACAANEKIMQMEETEKELKCCLKRISKEHRDIVSEHQSITREYECCREENQQLKQAMKPLNEALEEEKKRSKTLKSELCALQKVHLDSEKRSIAEMKTLRSENCCLRKEFQNSEVTNCELREEVNTLEQQIQKLQCQLRALECKVCELNDEIRTKEEMCQRMEATLKSSEGSCLAQELDGSPSKRAKRCDVVDLRSATQGLCVALRNVKDCDIAIPQFNTVARDVKRLADSLLGEEGCDQEDGVSKKNSFDCSKYDREGENDSRKRKSSIRSRYDDQEECEQDDRKRKSSIRSRYDDQEDSNHKYDREADQENRKRKSSIRSRFDDQEESVGEFKLERTEGGNDRTNVTVGLAFVPSFRMPPPLMHSYSSPRLQNKTISEVPSALRKLSALEYCPSCSYHMEQKKKQDNVTQTDLVHTLETVFEVKPEVPKPPPYAKKIRKPRRRFTYSSSWMARVRRMVSQLSNRRIQQSYETIDPDISKSEIMQRKISYGSFYSLNEAEEVVNLRSQEPFRDTDSIKTVLKSDNQRSILHIDQETETPSVSKADSGVQVSKEHIDTEHLLRIIPAPCRSFISMIKASIKHDHDDADEINIKIAKRWETDGDFQNGLEALRSFFLNDLKTLNSCESYEQFVSAITCLHVLSEIAKPLKIPILNQIETQLNERLMSFHTKKVESEFYCTVYYPIKRPAPVINLTNNQLK